MTLNLDYVRAQFPALAKNDFVFLDNAGGSLVPQVVADRVAEHLTMTPVQHGATYRISADATNRLKTAQADMAAFINAQRPEELVFAPSTTAMLRILGHCYHSILKPGDQVIVSNSEHESNFGPWQRLKDHGIEVIIWPIDTTTWRLEPETLKSLISDKTKLVCFNHVSNLVGTINPVKEITTLAHDHGAKVVVDGVAAAPHMSVDVQDLDVDYYIFSCYKTFGPHCAAFYGKYDNLLALPQQNHSFIGMEETAYKLQPGNANFELSWGCGGIIDYLSLLGLHHGSNSESRAQNCRHAYDVILDHERTLSYHLLSYLEGVADVTLIGKGSDEVEARVPTISFTHNKKSSRSIVEAIDPFDIGVRHGDFYARQLSTHLGLDAADGVVRISMAHYNTMDEMDRLLSHLKTVL